MTRRGRGWHRYPYEHGLAARGIRTKREDPEGFNYKFLSTLDVTGNGKIARFEGPFRVDTWFERDRSFVGVYDKNDVLVAEWWDEGVEQMFESGFFERGKDFEESVLAYLEWMGNIKDDDPTRLGRFHYLKE